MHWDQQERFGLTFSVPQCGVHQPDRFATLVAAENETEVRFASPSIASTEISDSCRGPQVAIRNWLDSNGLLRNGDAAGSS